MSASISAYHFDIILSVVIKTDTINHRDPARIGEFARQVAHEFCPETRCTDEMVDALVKSALKTRAELDASL